MTTRLPNTEEIERLVAYLPRLYAPGFEPVTRWEGGTQDAQGVWQLAWPEYDPLVREFFAQLGAGHWLDYEYDPGSASRMLAAERAVEGATLSQIRSMLTFCVRGERFSDGHWGEMIEQGHIRRLLVRLQQLLDEARGGGDGLSGHADTVA